MGNPADPHGVWVTTAVPSIKHFALTGFVDGETSYPGRPTHHPLAWRYLDRGTIYYNGIYCHPNGSGLRLMRSALAI